MPEIRLPEGWTTRGELPMIDPASASDEQIEGLAEDMLQIRTPAGDVLDVGWLPEMDRAGAYVCRLVRDGDWDLPLATMETRSPTEVREWLENAVQTLANASGSTNVEPFGPPEVTQVIQVVVLFKVPPQDRPDFSIEPREPDIKPTASTTSTLSLPRHSIAPS